MYNDILECVKRESKSIRDEVIKCAEQCAEVYVSSTLGLEDGHVDKQGIKDSYIEEFKDLMFKQLY